MKPLSTPLQDLFRTRAFARAPMYQLTLTNGTVIRMVAYDADLVWSAVTYSAGLRGGPAIGAQGRLHWRRGLAVDELTLEVIPKAAVIGNFSWADAIKYGLLDGATLKRWNAYMALATPTLVVGRLLMFSGRVGDIEGGNGAFTIHVKSFTELLDKPTPHRLFQAPCNNVLFDAGCTLNKASFAVAGTVSNGSSQKAIRTQLSQDDNYFRLGHLVFTSGILAGLSKTVAQWTKGNPGTMRFTGPLPLTPAAGDAFTVYPGCNLTFAACTSFANTANFGGFEFIPAPETAV